MKKIAYIFTAIALLCGCQKMEDFDQPVQGGTVNGELPEVIYASMADESQANDTTKTRTYVDGNKVLWHKGDEIHYCADRSRSAKYVFNGEDGASSATFDKVTDGEGLSSQVSFSLGIYPYDANSITPSFIPTENAEHSYWRTKLKYQQTQTYVPNSFGRGANLMIATGKDATDDDLYFRNACGFLVIKLYGIATKVKKIDLYPKDKNNFIFPAEYTIDADRNGNLSFYKGDNDNVYHWFMIDCNNDGNGVEVGSDREHATEFWFALPPMTIKGGITVRVEDIYTNVIVKETTKDITITRNEIQPMAAFDVTNTNKVTQLWYKKDDMTKPLQWDNAETYFGANILSNKLDIYKENPTDNTGEYMYCITFDRPLTEIKKDAFKDSEITKVVFPEALTTIGEQAFYNSKLTEITIPGTVNVIGNDAFSYCNQIKNVTFEPSPTKTALYCGTYFSESPLESVNFNRNVIEGAVEGVEGVQNSRITFFIKERTLSSVTLGDQVEYLTDWMFAYAPITSIEIPNSVTSIGELTFYDCEKLTSVTIPSSVTSVGDEAFKECSSLQSVTIAGTISSVNADMFKSCSAMKTLNITGSVGTIGESAFDGFGLTSLNISGQVGTIGKGAFDDNDSMTSFIVTGSVGTIGESAFNDCDALATVNITNTVDKVGAHAFSDCDAVTTLAILANTVDDYAYEDMDGLKTATLYGATVGKGVFYDCDALETITIDGSVNSIGNDAFDGCSRLSSVTFEGSSTSLSIGYQDHASDKGPFYDSPLSYINLNREIVCVNDGPGGLNAWDEGIFANSYYDKDFTTEIILGENVKTISDYMFSGVRVKNLTLPANVSSIGKQAFYDCRALEHVTCQRTAPPALGTGVFDSCDKNPSFAVPTNSLTDYKAAANWSSYASKMYGY